MDYKISIVIPVYNVEKYIRECLDSVVNQTIGIENIEVIVVNDCTPDNSMKIVEEYADKYPSIKILNQEKNSGLGPTRNLGLKEVSSDYVTFLDSDDFISENTCEYCLNKMEEGYDSLIYKYVLYNEEGDNFPIDIHQEVFQKEHVVHNINDIPEIIFSTSSCNKIYSKKLFKYLNFSNQLYEDNIVSMEVLSNSRSIFVTDKCTYFYRQSKDSITHSISINHIIDLKNVIDDLFVLSEKYPIYSSLFKFLGLKFSEDIVEWFLVYDFSYDIQKKVESSIKVLFKFNKEDILNFNALFPKYPINDFTKDIILNKLGYFEFLTKYNLDFEDYPNLTSNLYVDKGNGWGENKITVNYTYNKVNKVCFNLENYSGIINLLFVPVEGYFSISKILSLKSNVENIKIISNNSYNSLEDETQFFISIFPNYYIGGKFNEISYLQLEFTLKIIKNQADLSKNIQSIIDEKENNILNKQKIIDDMYNSSSWKITKPLRYIQKLFNKLIS